MIDASTAAATLLSMLTGGGQPSPQQKALLQAQALRAGLSGAQMPPVTAPAPVSPLQLAQHVGAPPDQAATMPLPVQPTGASGGPSPHQVALIQALRGEPAQSQPQPPSDLQQFGTLGLLTGDPVLSRVGQSLLGQAQAQGAQRMQQQRIQQAQRFQAGQAQQGRLFRARQAAMDRAARARNAELMAGQRAAAQQADQQAQALRNAEYQQLAEHQAISNRQANYVTPGYRLAPGAQPPPGELGNFRKALAAHDQLQQDIAALHALHQQYHSELLPDAGKAKMQAVVSDMKLKLKDLAALGALSGSDLQLLAGQVPDPTTFGSFLDDQTIPRLGQFSRLIDNALRAQMKSLGIVKAPTANSAAGLSLQRPSADEDRQAVQWARAHPKDPRSAQILRVNGL